MTVRGCERQCASARMDADGVDNCTARQALSGHPRRGGMIELSSITCCYQLPCSCWYCKGLPSQSIHVPDPANRP
ncbi:hypothetical protein IG631_21424 [Alternaria alternata]|nr:hypothetical protein IG631_21424 [Alternaria alternata]